MPHLQRPGYTGTDTKANTSDNAIKFKFVIKPPTRISPAVIMLSKKRHLAATRFTYGLVFQIRRIPIWTLFYPSKSPENF